jgi:hypothetical protein
MFDNGGQSYRTRGGIEIGETPPITFALNGVIAVAARQ